MDKMQCTIVLNLVKYNTINTSIKFDKLVAEINSAGMNIFQERNINEIQKAHPQ